MRERKARSRKLQALWSTSAGIFDGCLDWRQLRIAMVAVRMYVKLDVMVSREDPNVMHPGILPE
jgi:hypothetical protein